MSFIDNLRALLAYAGGQDDETEESFYDRLDKQKQFYTPVRNAKPSDSENSIVPVERHVVSGRYHPEIPDNWSTED